jgi:membrane protein
MTVLTRWREIAWQSWREAGDDNISLIAAGVAFYGFLALVPLLGAVVLVYGMVSNPDTVVHDMHLLTSVMPPEAAGFIGQQLMDVVKASRGTKGWGTLGALALALFGARNGAGSIIIALNVAFEVRERRGYILVNLLAMGTTALAVVTLILAMIAIAALSHLEGFLPTVPLATLALGKIGSCLMLVVSGTLAAATLYRFGPRAGRGLCGSRRVQCLPRPAGCC